ncbi:hypothetical protein [Leptothermofonsia sp. ETS-13]
MNTNKPAKSPRKSVSTSTDAKSESFDFDSWAVQVKRQMLDALNRRGLR